eukprot:gene5605-6295_t
MISSFISAFRSKNNLFSSLLTHKGCLKNISSWNNCSLHVSGLKNSNKRRQFCSSGPEIPEMTVEKAFHAINERTTQLDKPNLYIGIGQYFANPERERVIVFSRALFNEILKNKQKALIEPEILLDCSLGTEDIDLLLDKVGSLKASISHGEVNSIDKGQWNFGFTIKPEFEIFNREATVCHFIQNTKLRLVNGDTIDLEDIKSVNVYLSDEPWNEQSINLEMIDDSFVNLVDFEIDNDNRDLAMLMIDTEWTVKAAALLCLNIKNRSQKVDLKLPRNLTIQGNPWVENRQNTWTRLMLSSRDNS